ncbi:MAG: YceI family protein [Ramlibacter sp.]|nr:YceI family protein [Ramlibacter sp.]
MRPVIPAVPGAFWRRAFLAAGLVLAAAPQWAAGPDASLVPGASRIDFVIRQMGVPVEGGFGAFQARVAFDPRHPEAGSVALEIDTASAGLGVPQVDVELPKPVWFDAARFPKALFQSSRIRRVGDGQFEVTGTLTLKGRSRELVVPVGIAQSAGQSVATGRVTIQRLAFGVGDGEWADTSLLADDVQVRIKLVLAGLAPL